jgi:hypothetical protein
MTYGWVWVLWLALVIVSFAVLEGIALYRGNKSTLSECTWYLAKIWGPLPVLFGIVFGGLAVHFFWIAQGCDLK